MKIFDILDATTKRIAIITTFVVMLGMVGGYIGKVTNEIRYLKKQIEIHQSATHSTMVPMYEMQLEDKTPVWVASTTNMDKYIFIYANGQMGMWKLLEDNIRGFYFLDHRGNFHQLYEKD